MNLLAAASFAAFVLAFGVVAVGNLQTDTMTFQNPPDLSFRPPYSFDAPGSLQSELDAFFFTFLFSLLFFGVSAPVALALEGAKFGTLLVTGSPAFNFAFIAPQLFAAYAAILLGQGALKDFDGKENVFASWGGALKYFGAGLALTLALILVRGQIIG